MLESKARLYAEMNKTKDGSFVFRVAEIKFLIQGKNFVFEKASPLVETFDKIITQTIESGIVQKWEKERKLVKKSRDEYLMSTGDAFLVAQLCTISSFGFGISLIVFIIELAWHFFKPRAR